MEKAKEEAKAQAKDDASFRQVCCGSSSGSGIAVAVAVAAAPAVAGAAAAPAATAAAVAVVISPPPPPPPVTVATPEDCYSGSCRCHLVLSPQAASAQSRRRPGEIPRLHSLQPLPLPPRLCILLLKRGDLS